MIQQTVIVKAVVFDEQDRLLLIKRSKTAPRRPHEWDMPGGFFDKADESYQEACLRELYEETGIRPLEGTVILGYAESNIDTESRDASYDVSRLYFTVRTADTAVHLSYEHDESTWVSLERALELVTYDRQLRALSYLQRVRQTEQ